MLLEFNLAARDRSPDRGRFTVDHSDIVAIEEDGSGRCWVWLSSGAVESPIDDLRHGVSVEGTYSVHVARWREVRDKYESAETIATLVRDLSVIADQLEQRLGGN